MDSIEAVTGYSMKRYIMFIYLLSLSAFCFSQQSMPGKIYGQIPNSNSAKLYEIQVGAFKILKNAEDYALILKKGGMSPVYEQYLDYTRVKITGIAAPEVRSYLTRIKQLGFDEVIIRESSVPCTTVNKPEPGPKPKPEPKPEPEPEEELTVEAEEPETAPEPRNIDRDVLCRTWKIVNSNKGDYIGYIMVFSDDGTYLITNTTGETFVAKWRWHDEHAAFEYTHDNWRSYGRVSVHGLDQGSLTFNDPGFNILGEGYSTIRKDVVYELIPVDTSPQDTSEEE